MMKLHNGINKMAVFDPVKFDQFVFIVKDANDENSFAFLSTTMVCPVQVHVYRFDHVVYRFLKNPSFDT